MASKVRVLVVDDSAFVRKVVTQMLRRSTEIDVVGTARDGLDALEMVERHSPDVITLDLVMPRMNGVEFIREQNVRRRIPTIVCSIANQSGEMALEALELGAFDFVQKPTALATDRVYEIADELIEKVLLASRSARGASVSRATPVATPVVRPRVPSRDTRAGIVVIGISTGGPQALRRLIPQLPADFPIPIAMVLHMPIGYTAMYAQRLDAIAHLRVIEVAHGDLLQQGTVWLAPAGQHLTFVRDTTGEVRAHLDLRPSDTQHRPAVDVLFRSAADVFGSHVLGVVMTGMGNDGMLGAAHIKAQGGRVVTEAESSCVVYGMPRAVDEAALSDRSATLDEMADAITELI